MNNIQRLHNDFNQSPWIDNLSRELVASGRLQSYIDKGVRGMTTNPTILENAITHSTAYDAQIKELSQQGLSTEQIYLRIIEDDIRAATELFRPVFDQSGGTDGFVSLEVSPTLADDTEGTIEQARQLWHEMNIPNLMIKVPATDAGIPAVEQLLSEKINVNVTLIFSLNHYTRIAEAQRKTHSLHGNNTARSVASFFVSRVDTEIDKRLEALGTKEALDLRGQAAVAQAHLAYAIFLEKFGDAAVLESSSPAVQRLLWASTSTKNPAYDDLLYVRHLIAPLTVNTLPEDTLNKIEDHLPDDTRSLSLLDIEHAKDTMKQIAEVGVDLDSVTATLESEGVQKFVSSFKSVLAAVEAKS